MTSLAFRSSVACIACAVILGIGPVEQEAEGQDRQRPVFRAEVSSVAVDVSVRRRNAPVLGLGQDDFQLTDNGVVQRIDLVDLEAIPIDLSILLDVSGSTFGWIGQFRQNTADVAALLAPTDRFRIVCFGKDVREVVRMQTPDEPIRFGRWPYFGGTALYDALLLTILHNPGRNRRHLIVVFTDGFDTTSVVDGPDVTSAAARSDATVHLIQAPPYRGNPVTLFLAADGHGGQDVSLPRTTRHTLPSAVERIVAASGGDVYVPPVSGLYGQRVPFVPHELDRVLASYRSRYLLRYSPTGVTPDGWHQIAVRVPRLSGVDVTARRGYFSQPARRRSH